MFILYASLAMADTVTLDNGTLLAADLARYELDGDCQMTMTEGELQGAIVIVPCHRVLSFTRTSKPAPLVLRALTMEAVVDSGALEMPVEEAVERESAGGVEEAALEGKAELGEGGGAAPDGVRDVDLQRKADAAVGEGAAPAPTGAPRMAPAMPVMPDSVREETEGGYDTDEAEADEEAEVEAEQAAPKGVPGGGRRIEF